MDENIFNARMRERRAFLGLSLQDVAAAVGVTRSTIQRWESGEIKNVKRSKVLELARVLMCSASYLMGWTDDPLPAPDDAAVSRSECLFCQLAPDDQEAALRYMEFLLRRRLGGDRDD